MIKQGSVYIGLFILQMVSAFAISGLYSSIIEALALCLWWFIIFVVGLQFGRQSGKKPRPIYDQLTNTVLVLGLLVFLYQLSSAGLNAALIGLLLWMQAALNFSLHQRRQFYFTFVISFILVLYGAANSKSGLYIFIMAAYVLAAIYTLYANYFDERQQTVCYTDHTLTQRGVSTIGSVSTLLVFTLTMAVILYFTVPRPTALHVGVVAASGGQNYDNEAWEKEADGNGTAFQDNEGEVNQERNNSKREDAKDNSDNGSASQLPGSSTSNDSETGNNPSYAHYDGFRDEVDINNPGKGRISNALVMYVQSDRPLYLKGKVFDRFDGKYWRRANIENTKRRLNEGALKMRYDRPGDNPSEKVFQVITMAMDYVSTLFAAESVHELSFPARVIAQDSYGALEAPRPLTEGTIYSATSELNYVDQRPYGKTYVDVDAERYLQLPDDFSQRITTLANEITSPHKDNLSKAVALEQHLRSQYTYTFETVADESDAIALEHFLFESKTGHCEYFATAMVLMLRAMDIPARYVTGFSATNLNPITGYYEVRGLDAHAWVETYIKNLGWVLFEPTAFYSLPSQESEKPVAETLTEYSKRLADIARNVEPDALSTQWLTVWSLFLNNIKQLWQRFMEIITTILGTVWKWFVSGGSIIACVLALLVLFIHLSRNALRARFDLWRLQRETGYRQSIGIAYSALERYFKGKGTARPSAWTIDEYRQLLLQHYPDKEWSINYIANNYAESRYGNSRYYNQDFDQRANDSIIKCFKQLIVT